MRQRDYLEASLTQGLMLTAHPVSFSPTNDRAQLTALLEKVKPLLDRQLHKIGRPWDSLSGDRQRVLLMGLGTIRGSVPMLCFTEVPDGRRIDGHRNMFGGYGLVVDRAWLEQHGADKVLYVGDNSAVSRQLHSTWATMNILGLHPAPNNEVLFDNEPLRKVLELFAYVELREHIEEAEWRLAGSTGYMGGANDNGKRIPVPLENIEYVLVAGASDVAPVHSLVQTRAKAETAARIPRVLPFPDALP